MKRNPFPLRRVIFIFLLCIVSSSIMAQKVNLDTLTVDELNLYEHKAVKIRNTGIILTLSGLGIVVTGVIVGVKIANIPPVDEYDPNRNQWKGLTVGLLSGMAGMATIVVGVPLYAIGGNRYAKAEIVLKKFDIRPENSMAIGVGITLRF